MTKLSLEERRALVSARLEEMAAADPWSDPACVRDEKKASVIACIANAFENPTYAVITNELRAIKARGDGSVFRSRGEAHAALLTKQNGGNKVTVPITSDIKAKLKAMSASERLEVANKLSHERMMAGTKI